MAVTTYTYHGGIDMTMIPVGITLEERWATVKEARDALSTWLSNGQRHPVYGLIHLTLNEYINAAPSKEYSNLSLGGLWYLYKEGTLLMPLLLNGQVEDKVVELADFLDDIACQDESSIEVWLGVPYAVQTLAGCEYDPSNPTLILRHLDWLLEQHNTPTTDSPDQ